MNPRLPRSFYVIAILSGLLLWATHVIGKQQAALDARPLVEDFKADARVEDVRRDPVTIKRRTETTKPDGTKKVVDSERIIGAVASHTETKSESAHKETPVAPAFVPTRYVGAALTPLDWQHPRISAGLTFHGRLDLGGYWDTARRLNDGALGLESRYRW